MERKLINCLVLWPMIMMKMSLPTRVTDASSLSDRSEGAIRFLEEDRCDADVVGEWKDGPKESLCQ